MQQMVLSALLANYKMFRTHVNNINIHVKCHKFLSDFNQISIFSADFRESLQHQTSPKAKMKMRKHGDMKKQEGAFATKRRRLKKENPLFTLV